MLTMKFIIYLRQSVLEVHVYFHIVFYRITCRDPDFHLSNECLIRDCNAKNDSSGHYSCDQFGNKICLPGWTNNITNCITRKSKTFDVARALFLDLTELKFDIHYHTSCFDLGYRVV